MITDDSAWQRMNSDGPRWTQMNPDEPEWTLYEYFFYLISRRFSVKWTLLRKKIFFGWNFFFEKNSKFFSKFLVIFFSEELLQKCSVHAKTSRNRINRILIKGSFRFIRVHRGPSGYIRVQPSSSVVMRVHAGFKRSHAGSCGNMRGDDNLWMGTSHRGDPIKSKNLSTTHTVCTVYFLNRRTISVLRILSEFCWVIETFENCP